MSIVRLTKQGRISLLGSLQLNPIYPKVSVDSNGSNAVIVIDEADVHRVPPSNNFIIEPLSPG